MDDATRGDLLEHLAQRIDAVSPTTRPTRVAVDGADAAGKTTPADELAAVLRGRARARAREVIRASIDGFHRPRAERYRRGESSPEGCYHDTFDHQALRRVLLEPLGPRGDRTYQQAVFDHRTDRPVADPPATAAADAVLLFDGVFLLRPELADQWDLLIFVSAAFERTLERARTRDLALFGSSAEVERRYRERYIPAQLLYFAEARPAERADVIVHNDDPERPSWDSRR